MQILVLIIALLSSLGLSIDSSEDAAFTLLWGIDYKKKHEQEYKDGESGISMVLGSRFALKGQTIVFIKFKSRNGGLGR